MKREKENKEQGRGWLGDKKRKKSRLEYPRYGEQRQTNDDNLQGNEIRAYRYQYPR